MAVESKVFKLYGVDAVTGRKETRKVTAVSGNDARTMASNDGFVVFRSKATKAVTRSGGAPKKYAKASTKDLALFARSLALTTTSISDPVKSLRIAGKSVSPTSSLRRVATNIESRVQQGETFVEAVEAHRNVLGATTATLIKAGFESGDLSGPLKSMATSTERINKIRGKALQAAIYPTAMGLVSSVLLGVIVFAVLPKFKAVFVNLNVEIPIQTAFLFGVSAFVRSNIFAIFGVLFLTGIGLFLLSRTLVVKMFLAKLRLKTPVLKSVVRGMNILNTCDVVGVLFSANISDIKTFNIAAEAVKNIHIKEALAEIPNSILGGADLVTALKIKTPPLEPIYEVLAMQSLSGVADRGLPWKQHSENHSEELDRSIAKIIDVMPLIMMLGVAATTMLVMVSIFLPTISLYNSLGV